MVDNRKFFSLEEYKISPFMIGTMRMGQWGVR